MSRARPEAGCHDLGFGRGYPVTDAAEVALEDYARVLARSRTAEAIPDPADPARVAGVHVCGAGQAPAGAIRAELEEFARDLASRAGRGGLGWE